MSKAKLSAGLLFMLLILSDVVLYCKLSEARKESALLQSEIAARAAQMPIAEFNRLFIEKVLGAQGEVDFETRLELENKVRELGDENILARWNGFVNAQTEGEAQTEVKALLSLLAVKMQEK
jgi:hypothetical protein